MSVDGKFAEYTSARMIIDLGERHAQQPGTPIAAVTKTGTSTTLPGQVQPAPA